MPIFDETPRYCLGLWGILLNRRIHRGTLQIAAGASILTLLHAATVYGLGHVSPAAAGQMLFLALSPWVLLWGLMRLFFGGFLRLSGAVFSTIEDALPTLSSCLYWTLRIMWMAFDTYLVIAFFAMIAMANLVPYGLQW